MDENIVNPEEELQKVEDSIKKYQSLYRVTTEAYKQKQIKYKLNELINYRKKLMYLFELKERAENSSDEPDEQKSFLDFILDYNNKTFSSDSEINEVFNFLDFFDKEFLLIFSEQKLRFDFKYSMERDNFHHHYLELKRDFDDYISEYERIKSGLYKQDMALEIKKRSLTVKRNLFVRTHKFLKRLLLFTEDLLDDLNGNQRICLNGREILKFTLDRKRHYLQGVAVHEAIQRMNSFAREFIKYLNIPDVEK